MQRRWRGADYHITVENPQHVCRGVGQLYVDGKQAGEIPPLPAGSVCQVKIILRE